MHHLLLVAALLGQPTGQALGHLVIAGGGPTIPEVTAKALQLAGGKKARVVIIPQASSMTNAGLLSEEVWRAAGAKHVTVLEPHNPTAAQAAIRQADLIWMPGGSQSRLMEVLNQAGIIHAIQERFRQGATVGGTSAGAAVMSAAMLTGECKEDRLTFDAPKTARGLGLWPDVIIDQHYLRRLRFNRLLSAVLSRPENVGIGIDECTAVVVTGRTFEVVGKSNVIVIDARRMITVPSKEGEPEAAGNVSLHVLKAGMQFDLDRGLLTMPVLYSRGTAAASDRPPAPRHWAGLAAPK